MDSYSKLNRAFILKMSASYKTQQEWELEVDGKTRCDWISEGDNFYNKRNFSMAGLCFDEALRLTKNHTDAANLFLKRSHARLRSHNTEAALKDAEAALAFSSPENEEALFARAHALYNLRRFKESSDQISQLRKLSPKNQEYFQFFAGSLCRLNEQLGQINFATMVDEAIAMNPKPAMNRADYIGSIEVRICDVKSHGRGTFSTKPIKAGELLLVEKAFCASFLPPTKIVRDHESDDGLSDPGDGRSELAGSDLEELELEEACPEDDLSGVWAQLSWQTLTMIHRNPSLLPAFKELYAGTDTEQKTDSSADVAGPKTEQKITSSDDVKIDDDFVQKRIEYNAFAFPIYSSTWACRASTGGASATTTPPTIGTAMGLWLKASMINHSCHATVQRSFIGDMMIWRALTDIPADTELTMGYISSYGEPTDRQDRLAKYGFECECKLCHSQKNTPEEKLAERYELVRDMLTGGANVTPDDVDIYFSMIEKTEETYVFPASQEPRIDLIMPIIFFMNNCRAENMMGHSFAFGLLLLEKLGFEIETSSSHWKIVEWGFIGDIVPAILADLLREHKISSAPEMARGLYQDVKTAYMMIAGEAETLCGVLGEELYAECEGLMKGNEVTKKAKMEKPKSEKSKTENTKMEKRKMGLREALVGKIDELADMMDGDRDAPHKLLAERLFTKYGDLQMKRRFVAEKSKAIEPKTEKLKTEVQKAVEDKIDDSLDMIVGDREALHEYLGEGLFAEYGEFLMKGKELTDKANAVEGKTAKAKTEGPKIENSKTEKLNTVGVYKTVMDRIEVLADMIAGGRDELLRLIADRVLAKYVEELEIGGESTKKADAETAKTETGKIGMRGWAKKAIQKEMDDLEDMIFGDRETLLGVQGEEAFAKHAQGMMKGKESTEKPNAGVQKAVQHRIEQLAKMKGGKEPEEKKTKQVGKNPDLVEAEKKELARKEAESKEKKKLKKMKQKEKKLLKQGENTEEDKTGEETTDEEKLESPKKDDTKEEVEEGENKENTKDVKDRKGKGKEEGWGWEEETKSKATTRSWADDDPDIIKQATQKDVGNLNEWEEDPTNGDSGAGWKTVTSMRGRTPPRSLRRNTNRK